MCYGESVPLFCMNKNIVNDRAKNALKDQDYALVLPLRELAEKPTLEPNSSNYHAEAKTDQDWG